MNERIKVILQDWTSAADELDHTTRFRSGYEEEDLIRRLKTALRTCRRGTGALYMLIQELEDAQNMERD